jgi:RNA polymerase sigma-70 factor (ECF subfamily)
MDDAHGVTDLVQRCRAGDRGAAEQLFVRYSRQLVLLAQRRLGPRLAAREDGEDVVQSVFCTFFRRNSAGEVEIENSGQLWRLLVTITLRKVGLRHRRHRAGCRAVTAEADADLLVEVAARDPGPEADVALADELTALTRDLPAQYQEMFRLRLQGRGATEIAQMLNVSRRTVHRAVEWVRSRLEARAADSL